MYEDYFGFVQPPFSLTPDPRFLYRSESHDVALQQVWQAIRRKEGFIVLTGDIGTGKTTLCRTLLEQFDQTTFTALILNPFLSVEELLREVLISFGVVSKEALKTGRLATASKHELVRTLHDFLLSLVPLHGSAVLIIDEAQHLSTDVLEEIRVLSNLETNDQKLLQIVIVGQLNLLDVLHKAELRQLDQRISIRCSLKALTREEVEAYVTHRLWVARGSTSVTFTPKAFDLVHAMSGGVPRMINLVCDRALMVGCEKQTSRISEEHVVAAAAQLGLEVPKNKIKGERASTDATTGTNRTRLIAAVALVVAALAAAFWFLGNPLDLMSTGEMPAIMQKPARHVATLAPPALPAQMPEPAAVPPPIPGSFSVLVGTYDNARQAQLAETQIRNAKVEPYTIDIVMGPDDVQRRILVGRFATREEAEAVRQKIGPQFTTARVILGAQERVRLLVP
ncbi:MAG TPA: AAA family ATPase [Vicinamibacterales bacterium]|nr:AAA family ATPase [Vicinamibacterales bacterium]